MAIGASNPLNVGSNVWCKICKTRGQHHSKYCYILKKYVQNPKSLYWKLCKSVGHDENNCQAYELMMERSVGTYRMQEEECKHEGSG